MTDSDGGDQVVSGTPEPNPAGQRQQPSLLLGLFVLSAIAVVLGMMLYGLLTDDNGDDRSPAERQADYERVHAELFPPPVVEYHITGVSTSVDITVATPTGTSQQQNISVPLTRTTGERGLRFEGFEKGDSLYISAQISDPDTNGTIACAIVVNGETVSRVSASGFPSIATCDAQVP